MDKITFFYGSDEIAVQTQNICAIHPDPRKQYKGATVIKFTGEKENYIHVKESVDEIGAMITE